MKSNRVIGGRACTIKLEALTWSCNHGYRVMSIHFLGLGATDELHWLTKEHMLLLHTWYFTDLSIKINTPELLNVLRSGWSPGLCMALQVTFVSRGVLWCLYAQIRNITSAKGSRVPNPRLHPSRSSIFWGRESLYLPAPNETRFRSLWSTVTHANRANLSSM